jgi:hypothetical protein
LIVVISGVFSKRTLTVHTKKDDSNVEVHYFTFLAVLAASLKSLAEGAPAVPTFRIFSPEPALMRLRFAAMFA